MVISLIYFDKHPTKNTNYVGRTLSISTDPSSDKGFVFISMQGAEDKPLQGFVSKEDLAKVATLLSK